MSETPPAATAAKAIVGAILRHLLSVAGTSLVAHGYLDSETASSATGPLADYIMGSAIVAGAVGWSTFRAWVSHTRFYQAWISPAKPAPNA